MKSFRTHLEESKKHVQWQQSAFELAFLSPGEMMIPLLPSIFKNIQTTGVQAYHVTNHDGAIDVIKNQGRKNFHLSADISGGSRISYSDGVWRKGVGLVLEGTTTVSRPNDIMSIPDNAGNRWVSLGHILGPQDGKILRRHRKFEKVFEAIKVKIANDVYQKYVPDANKHKSIKYLTYSHAELLPEKVKQQYLSLFMKSIAAYVNKYEKDLNELLSLNLSQSIGVNYMSEAIIYNYKVIHVVVLEKERIKNTGTVFDDQLFKKFRELISLLDQNNIPYTVRDYNDRLVNNKKLYPGSTDITEPHIKDNMKKHNHSKIGPRL